MIRDNGRVPPRCPPRCYRRRWFSVSVRAPPPTQLRPSRAQPQHPQGRLLQLQDCCGGQLQGCCGGLLQACCGGLLLGCCGGLLLVRGPSGKASLGGWIVCTRLDHADLPLACRPGATPLVHSARLTAYRRVALLAWYRVLRAWVEIWVEIWSRDSCSKTTVTALCPPPRVLHDGSERCRGRGARSCRQFRRPVQRCCRLQPSPRPCLTRGLKPTTVMEPLLAMLLLATLRGCIPNQGGENLQDCEAWK